MKLLLLPDSQTNAYLRQLSEALERHAVSVTKVDAAQVKTWFPVVRALRTSGKPTVVHFHWTNVFWIARTRWRTLGRGMMFLGEVLAIRLGGVRVVWTVHNIAEHERRQPGLELLFGRLLSRLSHSLIVHCQTARQEVVSAYRVPARQRHKIVVIQHGHYIGVYPNAVTREEARGQLSICQEALVYLHLGLVRPYKGVFELVDAFRSLDDPRAILIIAGMPTSDSTRNELERRCNGDARIRTRFEFLPDDELQVYANAADVFVLPYRNILTSGSAVMAMSFSKPVIAPRLGCMSETLDETEGFLYDPDRPSALLEAMQLASASDLVTMGRLSYERIRRLDWDAVAAQTLDAYGAKPR